VYRNDVNLGLIKTLNRALKIAKGKYIARMDADDISHKIRLERQVKFFEEHDEYVLVGAFYNVFGAKNRKIKLPTTDEGCRLALLTCSPFCHPVVMFRRSIIDEHNLQYDLNYQHAEDYNFFQRVSLYGKLANIPEILLDYRYHSQQISRKYAKEQMISRVKSSAAFLNVSMEDIPAAILTTYDDNNDNRMFFKGLLEVMASGVCKFSFSQRLFIFKKARFWDVIKFIYWKVI
jgi:cellulose synthase/poly-beta-1,6-N-acetylglucosamine synthase-like glycosyltransferase